MFTSGIFAEKFPLCAVLMDEKTIKSNISQRRRALSISQTEMAERLGVDRNTYRNIESGQTRIINHLFGKIAEELKISQEELMLGYSPEETGTRKLTGDVLERYDGRVETLTQEYEQKLAATGEEILRLKKRESELEEMLRDKNEILEFLRDKVRRLDKNGRN